MPRARREGTRLRIAIAVGALVGAMALPPARAQLICGDCDGNLSVDIIDALKGARFDAGLTTLSPSEFDACNVVQPMVADVSILDALAIARYVVGLLPTLGCLPSGPPAATKLYVNVGNAVEIVDLATNASVGTIPISGVGQGIDIGAAGAFVYATASGNLYEIDTGTDIISRTLPLNRTTARKVAVVGSSAYVAHFVTSPGSTVDRVDLLSTLVSTLAIGVSAWEITASQSGTQLYTAYIGSGDRVTRISTASFTVGGSTPLSNNPIAIEEDPITGDLYVAARDASPDISGLSDLHVLDATSLASVGSFAIDDAFGLAVLPDGSALYTASNHQTGAPAPPYFARKVDLITATVLPVMIPIGDQPWYFTVDVAGRNVYTCDNASNQISRIDTVTDTVIATIPLTAAPRDAVTR